MTKRFQTILLLMIILSANTHAESKRVIVYEIGQHVWEIQPGDTLSVIIQSIAPGLALAQQLQLQQQIVDNNPQAFINQDADRLIAGQKLWFNRSIPVHTEQQDNQQYDIQNFSWGSIKRLRE